MSKAVLVMDMPTSCSRCPCINECDECMAMSILSIDVDIYKERPHWCPLKELPEKKSIYNPDSKVGYNSGYSKGYNDCIKEILKGSD